MSTRSKKPRAPPARKSEAVKEEKVEKVEKPERETKPKGVAPRAFVSARKGDIMITRDGRGFSFRELQGASFPLRFTRLWRVPVDLRRRSVLSANVEALKKWYVPAPRPPPPKVPKEAVKPKASKEAVKPKASKEQKEQKAKVRKEAPRKRAPSKKQKS